MTTYLCRKCNITFERKEEACKHLVGTGFVKAISEDEPWKGNNTFFHVVTNEYGDDILTGLYMGIANSTKEE